MSQPPQQASTVTAEAARTAHCFRCQHYPGPDDPPLQKCGGCRARHYCSRDCQRADWRSHNQECQILGAGGEVPNRVRSTMRMTLGGLRRPDKGDTSSAADSGDTENNLIYHLKTSRHSFGDVTLSGPYLTIGELVSQVWDHLRKAGSKEGQKLLLEQAGEGSYETLRHLNAPLPDGDVIRFDVLREENVKAKSQGAGPYYVVRVTIPKLDSNGEPARGVMPGHEDFMQTLDIQPIKTLTSKQEAIAQARAKLVELKNEAGPKARVIDLGETDDHRELFNGFVDSEDANGQVTMDIVSVHMDDGLVDPRRSF
jgi:hypothetical protein